MNNMNVNPTTNKNEGNWSDVKGKIKTKWSKFTDSDIDSFEGHMDEVVGKVQKTYGYSKEQAEREFAEFKKSLTKNQDESKDSDDSKPTDDSKRFDNSKRSDSDLI